MDYPNDKFKGNSEGFDNHQFQMQDTNISFSQLLSLQTTSLSQYHNDDSLSSLPMFESVSQSTDDDSSSILLSFEIDSDLSDDDDITDTYYISDDEDTDEDKCSLQYTDDDIAEINYVPEDPSTWRRLVFETPEEAYELYQKYANSRGFYIKKSNSKRNSKNEKADYVGYIKLMCHKQGKKVVKESLFTQNNVNTRSDIRTNYNARMMLKKDTNSGRYYITNWNDNHNHELTESDKRHFLRMNRTISEEQKVIIANHIEAGISARCIYDFMVRQAGGISKLGFLRKDLKNYLSCVHIHSLKPGEPYLIQEWFKDQVLYRPRFVYDIQVDEEDSICSIFWADSAMRLDYQSFGDFVSFDITYRTNNLYRPLGIFVGLNNHKTICVFGGALLYDETGSTFTWLFNTFLKCMNGKTPETFMTDQAPAIAVGVRTVFPLSFHALCTWHIKHNAKNRLGARASDEFMDEFKHLIKHVDSEEQFEYTWNKIITTFLTPRLKSDLKWTSDLYKCRKQWSAAWVKDAFTAGQKTTQLSKQFNALARYYVKTEHTIRQFLTSFQSLVDDLRHNELMDDHMMKNCLVNNKYINSGLMTHAAKIFTPIIFSLIQLEYEAAQTFTIVLDNQLNTDSANFIRVERYNNQFMTDSYVVESEIVRFDLGNKLCTCSCRFFENWGIICRHSLRVLESFAVFGHAFCHSIPDYYVKERWCRNYKLEYPIFLEEVRNDHKVCKIFGDKAKYLSELVTAATTRCRYNDAAYDVLVQSVLAGIKEADKLLTSGTTSQPTRYSCSSLPDGDLQYEFPYKKIKKRADPNKSKTRLKSMSEKRHLLLKQQIKREIERMKNTVNESV